MARRLVAWPRAPLGARGLGGTRRVRDSGYTLPGYHAAGPEGRRPRPEGALGRDSSRAPGGPEAGAEAGPRLGLRPLAWQRAERKTTPDGEFGWGGTSIKA